MNRLVFLVQPPFIQLNSPYPALYYLKAFLEKHGCTVKVRDHSIGLFERIFSRQGLERIFADAARAMGMGGMPKNRNIIHTIERFLSEEKLWLDSIDRLINFLRGRDREWGHFLCLANGNLPGGPRCDTFIAEHQGEISPDIACLLASKMLADLADFITVTLDSGFSLIRYLPSIKKDLVSDFQNFSKLEKSLSGYIMKTFYRPFLEEEWNTLLEDYEAAYSGPHLLGISIPFPGCLVPALVCAGSAKNCFRKNLLTIAGGGYVNTELRFTDKKTYSKYFDHLSLDRPYDFFLSILENQILENRSIQKSKSINDEMAKTVFPDYSEVDFSRYLYPVDNDNPMHRLWSDGHWLKAYLAHGCYWHSCSFCDTSLDYIRNFIPVDPKALFLHLKDQAGKTGCKGVHFVDEAAPPASLLKFALLNREAGLPLTFWGNIRLEKNFDPDLTAILAAGGMVGVSTGLEITTQEGLERINKGLSLRDLVHACAAFKEAGILVHGYLIFGYWDQDEEEIINSAEIIRQFFRHDLLDSAFWHKFVLTCHSKVYTEKKQGLHQDLKIRPFPEDSFTLNDLSFKGEEKYDKYSEPLDKLLAMWMSGYGLEPDIKLEDSIPFKVKTASVAPDLILGLLDEYARNKRNEQNKIYNIKKNIIFIGSRPIINGKSLKWRWRLEDQIIKITSTEEAEKIARLLEITALGNMKVTDFIKSLTDILGEKGVIKVIKTLRKKGLALF